MPAGIDTVPTWMPAMMGATVGGLYAALNRAGMRKFWRSPSTQLNVLITGGGKGEPGSAAMLLQGTLQYDRSLSPSAWLP